MNSVRCRFSEQCLDCRAQLGRVFTGSILNREWTGALFIAGIKSATSAVNKQGDLLILIHHRGQAFSELSFVVPIS